MKHNYPALITYLEGRIELLSLGAELGINTTEEMLCNMLEKIRLSQIMNGEEND